MIPRRGFADLARKRLFGLGVLTHEAERGVRGSSVRSVVLWLTEYQEDLVR
jgi:hypothetical protein